jgi:hypothetical protein
VEVYLESGTAVNVTLQGHNIDVEVPYSGMLFSHYKDNASIDPRIINGVRREESIIDITPNFGVIYYLNNSNFVPTTMMFLINESTTSKMAMIITNHHLQTDPFTLSNDDFENQFEKKQTAIERNKILTSMQQLEVTSMQDDGAPLSLKDKNEKSMAWKISVSKFILLMTILILPNQLT